ncbi:MAG: hypothetical protein AAF202_04565 [Pseudomonadota bacterium]
MKLLKALVLSTLLLALPAFGSSVKTPIESKKVRKASLVLNTGYTTADNTDTDGVTFFEAGAGVNFALNEKFSLSGQVSQGLLTSNFGTGFTSLGLGLEYSVFGSNVLKGNDVALENYSVMNFQGAPSPTLSVALNARQVFFNGSSQVFPFSGIGVCAKYRPFVTSTGHWGVDVCYDYLLNPPNTTSMIRALLGWSVFLF